MDSNGSCSVQYDRWNEDSVNMNVEESQSAVRRIYGRVCVGRTGILVKTAGVLAVLASVYIIGYMMGFYIHRCS